MDVKKLISAIAAAAVLLGAETQFAQDLGHKLPGLIGLDAGRISEPGLYLLDRVVFYQAGDLRDRNGNEIPLPNLQMSALSNAVGIAYVFRIGQHSLWVTSSAAAPLARLRLNVHDRPEASFDRFGLADAYILPARIGWRRARFDIVGSYALYLPTGAGPLAGGKGVSSGQTTHEFSGGGAIYMNNDRTLFATALGSYNLNLRKRGIDITRGDTLQIQGGVGIAGFHRALETGLAGYALWQVRPDRGSALPAVLRGARDRVYGVGPEVAVFVRSLRSQVRARYEWDMATRSRPQGGLLSIGINVVLRRAEAHPVSR